MEGTVIPPIGTTEFPFIGDFNGNNKTIANLIISNSNNDFPTNLKAILLGESIGFFGVINSIAIPYNVNDAGKAYDFYIKNVHIKNVVDNAHIGIIAGYNNGSLERIGVINASFQIKANITSSSEYLLMGKLGSNTIWLDKPLEDGETTPTETENKGIVKLIDFVMRANKQLPELSETYQVSNTILTFKGMSNSDGYLYFNKTAFGSFVKVFYYS